MSMPALENRIMDSTGARNAKLKAIAGLRKIIGHIKKNLASHERKLKRLESGLLQNPLDKKPDPVDFSGVASKQEIDLIKIIGRRLREARQLCEHKTNQAAALLSVTSHDLQKIEGVVDVGHIPLWLIKKAAETYCVPVDYLFGLIDDFDAADGEVFLSRNHLAALQRQEHENFSKTAAEQLRQVNQLTAMNSAVASAVMAVQHVGDAFNRFRYLNPVAFENMPGGASLVRQVKIAEDLSAHATCVLTRYKALPESLMAHADYMFQTFPTQNGYFPE